MEKTEITSMSSRGQVVIPQNLREKMKLKEGEKFVVFGGNGTILFRKIETSSFRDFDKLIKRTQEFVKIKGITKSELEEAIRRARR